VIVVCIQVRSDQLYAPHRGGSNHPSLGSHLVEDAPAPVDCGKLKAVNDRDKRPESSECPLHAT